MCSMRCPCGLSATHWQGQFGDQPDIQGARLQLGLDADRPVLCIMPGSRAGEVNMMAEVFLDTAAAVLASVEGLQLVIPAANEARYAQLTDILAARPELDIKLILQQSHLAMEACRCRALSIGHYRA